MTRQFLRYPHYFDGETTGYRGLLYPMPQTVLHEIRIVPLPLTREVRVSLGILRIAASLLSGSA